MQRLALGPETCQVEGQAEEAVDVLRGPGAVGQERGAAGVREGGWSARRQGRRGRGCAAIWRSEQLLFLFLVVVPAQQAREHGRRVAPQRQIEHPVARAQVAPAARHGQFNADVVLLPRDEALHARDGVGPFLPSLGK